MPRTNLDAITDFPGLLTYLEEELDWPINEATFEEATFDFTPAELGLKADAVGGPIEIKQLRKLTDNQPWGVFFLNLPQKRLPQTIVRNILGRLTVKKRQASNDPSRPAFLKSDLLFITSTGAGADRRLAFAHFRDDPLGGNAATLKILGWDGDDTPRRLELTKSTLAAKLHWPDNPADTERWRAQWSAAFTRADTRTVVRDSKEMAKALAGLARRIRARAAELIEAQTDDGSLVKLHAAFKEALIHDLTPAGFADTYAQTVAYGLLSTRISRASGALTQDDVTANVAGTSPFLKEMLGQFIEAGGKKAGKAAAKLDFDELGIGEVVELLRNADMDAVLADFDRKNPDEDPVIHFYELFLKEYDAEQKVKRGVFYTPRPVVSFIVRSVDEVLRSEFHLADGLASTATWGEVIAASAARGDAKPIKLPAGAALADPFIRILDPATGTGTFLVECVDLIHKTMLAKWQRERHSAAEIKALWNAYVPKHLLPRLTGFELMMAPYAIAHVKLGLKLSDTGYRFGSDARAQIYLTNALEPAQDLDMQLAFMSDALAHEAKAANDAKETRFTVVVGNPPYNSRSDNNTPWVRGIINNYKITVRTEETQIQALSDDYVKFIALSELQIMKSDIGVAGFITNNGYLDGRIFRDLRRSLGDKLARINIINLHGDSRKKEIAPDGSKDENVFDIQQGVSIFLGSRFGDNESNIKHTDLWGKRSVKTKELMSSLNDMKWSILSQTYVTEALVPRERTDLDWPKWQSAAEIFGTGNWMADKTHFYGAGFKSQQDEFAIGFDALTVEQNIEQLTSAASTESMLRSNFELCKSNQWDFGRAKARLTKLNWRREIRRVLFRPFDDRYTLLHPDVVTNPRLNVMQHLSGKSVAFLATRSSTEPFAVFVTNIPPAHKIVGNYDMTIAFPLWLKAQGTETRTLPNIAPIFAKRVAVLTGLAWDDCVEEPKQAALTGVLPPKPTQTAMFATRRERGESGHSFGPRDLLDWIYAVLHSPVYRSRYADNTKSRGV